MDERTTCEDLELMSSWDATISSGGIGGGWDARGRGAVVVGASSIWGLVVWDVEGAAVAEGTSRVIGEARVRRGGELCVGEICLVGEGEDRTGVSRRFLLREADLRGRRPWEVAWVWREEERYGDREGWRGFGRA